MADWRTLVSGAMATDVERGRANPIGGVFGALLKEAMTQKGEARREAAAGRTAARSAVYGTYPGVAAKELGIDVPERTIPTGMEAREYTDPTTGVKYKAPAPLDAEFFAGEYTDYRLKMEETNKSLQMFNKETIEIPQFKKWMETVFPEYSADVLRGMKKTKKRVEKAEEAGSAAAWLEAEGWDVTEENIRKLKEANPPGSFTD